MPSDVPPATIEGALKMPAPITIPTISAMPSRTEISGCGAGEGDTLFSLTQILFQGWRRAVHAIRRVVSPSDTSTSPRSASPSIRPRNR